MCQNAGTRGGQVPELPMDDARRPVEIDEAVATATVATAVRQPEQRCPLTAAAAGVRSRIDAIDAVRGGVMMVMALDHVRDFLHRAAMTSLPTDLAVTTPLLFATRWITHLCAPMFMLTAGLAAYLWRARGRSQRDLSVYLLGRGLGLIVIELTVMRVAYDFEIASHNPVLLLVLWALGLSMIGLAAASWLPTPLLAACSAALIAAHNLSDALRGSDFGSWAWVWRLLHEPGAILLPGTVVVAAYPLVPWVAVMALGFCLGPLYTGDPQRRRRWLAIGGGAAVAAFFLLRAFSSYGDPAPWTTQPTPLFTVLSFLNTTKYPPSLAFLLMTLGPGLLWLAAAERWPASWHAPLVVFGRVPLFYFVLHFFVAHTVTVALAFVRYGSAASGFVFHPVPSMGGPRDLYPSDFGYGLGVTYIVWIAVVAGLYWPCRWFAGLKSRHPHSWLCYL